jgi:carboxyl-terminal processing protease
MSRVLRLICCAIAINFAGLNVFAEVGDQTYYKQFQDVFERIKRDYVQDPDRQKMTDSAINGMLTSLDPHSSYFVDEDLEDFINQTKGEFGGIGVEVIFENGAVKIISPIDDLPADKAGIKAGDYIIGVNDELVATLGYNKAVKEMRGDPGTTVKLLVIKENEAKPKEVELTREIVKIKPIKSNLEDGDIAYVRIVTFNEHTITELKKSIKKLESETVSGIRGIILDMRNNPGGLLEQAFAVSEYFIDSGVIVSTKGRSNGNNSVLTASKFVPKAPNVPIVALINAGSASASEIVAGALQDYKRGLLVGTKSFGKGSVQTFVQISPRAAVKLTTAKYYTPSGRSIQAEGIEPDILIEPAKVEYADQKDEKRFSEASLKNYLKNEKEKDSLKDPKGGGESDKKDPKSVAAKEPKKPSELYLKDYQFARAYDLIRGLILTKIK